MLDILSNLDMWYQHGEKIAVATVMSTWGSAPRPVGSKMVVTQSGRIAGSVSAGCVEGAVIEEAFRLAGEGCPVYRLGSDSARTSAQVGLNSVKPNKSARVLPGMKQQQTAGEAPGKP